MSNYTHSNISTSLNSQHSGESGACLSESYSSYEYYSKLLAKTGGMRLFQFNEFLKHCSEHRVVRSEADFQMLFFILSNSTQKGEVKESGNREFVGPKYLSEKFSLTRQKTSQIIKRCIDAKLIKKNGRKLILNPYIVCPHGVGNDGLYILQTYWDSNFTYDITLELAEAKAKDETYKNIMKEKIQEAETYAKSIAYNNN